MHEPPPSRSRSTQQTPLFAWLVIGVVVALVGCGPSTPSGSTGPGQSGTVTGLPDLGLASVQTDNAAARGATIGPEGGSISATGSNGATYTLTVPADSLPIPIAIGVYPVTRLANLPSGAALTAGVQFAPDGLFLAAPATLTIRLPQGIDQAALHGVGWTGDGEAISREHALVKDGTATLQIFHFSGSGVAAGNPPLVAICGATDWVCLEQDVFDRLETILAAPDPRGPALALLKEWYRSVVEPGMSALTTAEVAAVEDMPVDDPWAQSSVALWLYDLWLSAISDTAQTIHDPAFTVAPEVERSKPMAIAYARALFEANNAECARHDGDPPVALQWADWAMWTERAIQSWGVATKANDLDYESLLDESCIQVRIKPSRNLSASKPGDTGSLDVPVDLTIATKPIAPGVLPVQVEVHLTGSTSGGKVGIVDDDGHFRTEFSWPDGVDPIRIDVLATVLGPPGLRLISGTSASRIARFDRITKSSKPRIAFASSQGITVMNLDGSGVRHLTDRSGLVDRDPTWSPDGSRIAFARNSDTGSEIYVVNVDGTNLVHLAGGPGESDTGPAWSPDGESIAFTSVRGSGSGIYLMDPNGSNQRQLTTNVGDANPVWSPDGGRIAFASARAGQKIQIHVIDADGGDEVAVTTCLSSCFDPAWSPDALSIAFQQERDHQYDIFVIQADGSGLVALTSFAGSEAYPAWSPDGSLIAFAREIASDDAEIFVMAADGSGQRAVTTGLHAVTPAWAP